MNFSFSQVFKLQHSINIPNESQSIKPLYPPLIQNKQLIVGPPHTHTHTPPLQA